MLMVQVVPSVIFMTMNINKVSFYVLVGKGRVQLFLVELTSATV